MFCKAGENNRSSSKTINEIEELSRYDLFEKETTRLIQQAEENSTGFPDLFIWNEKDYHFYEVKSPNDHLSAQQLFWPGFLASAKIKAEVLRINYTD